MCFNYTLPQHLPSPYAIGNVARSADNHDKPVRLILVQLLTSFSLKQTTRNG